MSALQVSFRARRLFLQFRCALFPFAVFTGLLALGCDSVGEDESLREVESGGEEADPELWRLSEAPILEIGVREGAEEYQFFRVGGSLRLPDGRIVVANTGARELRVFDADGGFLKTVGRDGEGPGEFRWPSRVRLLGPDTLLVWDQSLQRISLFDGEGRFLSMIPLRPSPGNLFPGDEWLMGKNWIDSPLAPRDREPVRVAVEALPPVDSVATLRYVKVTNDGWLWVSSVRPPSDSAIVWRIHDLTGRQVARATTPPRFQPHEIGPDYVLGRYLDPVDVNLVRLYALERPGGRPRLGEGFFPSAALGPESGGVASDRSPTPVSEEVMANMRSVIKNLASLEEIHYSKEMTYTSDLDVLGLKLRGEAAEVLEIGIPFAGTEGWMLTMTHRPSGRMCAMFYGYFVPMGWSAGQILCP